MTETYELSKWLMQIHGEPMKTRVIVFGNLVKKSKLSKMEIGSWRRGIKTL